MWLAESHPSYLAPNSLRARVLIFRVGLAEHCAAGILTGRWCERGGLEPAPVAPSFWI